MLRLLRNLRGRIARTVRSWATGRTPGPGAELAIRLPGGATETVTVVESCGPGLICRTRAGERFVGQAHAVSPGEFAESWRACDGGRTRMTWPDGTPFEM